MFKRTSIAIGVVAVAIFLAGNAVGQITKPKTKDLVRSHPSHHAAKSTGKSSGSAKSNVTPASTSNYHEWHDDFVKNRVPKTPNATSSKEPTHMEIPNLVRGPKSHQVGKSTGKTSGSHVSGPPKPKGYSFGASVGGAYKTAAKGGKRPRH
jgi:hypothetical protein